MKNTGRLTVVALLAMAATGAFAEGDWFREAGYGLFVHWGCYAVPAKGEWYLNGSQMDPDEYAKFADRFGAEKPSGYTKGKWWWHTPACWLRRGQAGKHTVEIETLPPEKPNDPVGFRLSVLMIGQ